MTVTSFALDSVITGLAAALDTALDVPVYDGAIVAGDSNFTCVVIGSNGDPRSSQQTASFTHTWHDFEMTTDEVGQIQCAVAVWGGDSDADVFARQRAIAVGVLQEIDQTVRASITASQLGVDELLWSKIDSGQLIAEPAANGTMTRLPFVYGYSALLIRT